MTSSDFAWVNFDHVFTPNSPTATRTFQVDGVPVAANPNDVASNAKAEGYVLVQALDVENSSGSTESLHRIQINGTDLPAFDIPVEGRAWQTWMDRIPPGLLKFGDNRITVIRGGNDADNFRVANIAVHWREKS